MTIGQTIKLYRKEKNLTQSELAELIGVSTQAISKWETDSGMPDISQLIPLARVLEISTDNLLGNTDLEFEKEVTELRQKFGGINFISDLNYAEELYILTSKFFNRHPDVSDIAVVALETYIELFAKGKVSISKTEFLEECERYANSIFRYETVADRIYKTHYLMSRAYDLCGDEKKRKVTQPMTSVSLQTVLTDYQGKSSAIKHQKSCLSKNLTSFMPHKRWEVAGADVGFLRSGFALSSQSNIILLQIVTFL